VGSVYASVPPNILKSTAIGCERKVQSD